MHDSGGSLKVGFSENTCPCSTAHCRQSCRFACPDAYNNLMVDQTWLGAVLGYLLFGIGGIGYAYMDYSVHGERMFFDFKRSNPIRGYKERMRGQGAPAWPLYLVGFMPVGILVAFASILLSNRSR
jgi:hypothetical protein